MDMTSLLIQLAAGVAGGNAAGLLRKAGNLGPLLNSILGAIGGVAGGSLVGGILGGGTTGVVGSSAVAGALLPFLLSLFKPKAG